MIKNTVVLIAAILLSGSAALAEGDAVPAARTLFNKYMEYAKDSSTDIVSLFADTAGGVAFVQDKTGKLVSKNLSPEQLKEQLGTAARHDRGRRQHAVFFENVSYKDIGQNQALVSCIKRSAVGKKVSRLELTVAKDSKGEWKFISQRTMRTPRAKGQQAGG